MPERATILVPLLEVVPIRENHFPPFSIIEGIVAKVSRLLTTVGLSKSPFSTGNGGRGLGSPNEPYRESSSAVSSPHTYAPPPRFTFKEKENEDPIIFLPKMPSFSACVMATSNLSRAI